jgi:endonuclease/exonuclease/phosphatase (EEP) superfamily protein YafD
MESSKKIRVKLSRPKRPLGKVFASVRQVVRVQHVSDQESVWIWGEASEAFIPKKIRFAVWNLWKGSGGVEFEKEFISILGEADLILTQEALLTHEMLILATRPGFEAVHAATYRRMDGCRDGVMTLCRAKQAQPPERVISGTAEPLLKTTKASLLTFYRYGNGAREVLAIANLHSTLIRSPRTAGLEIRRVIERLEEHPGPVIFAGDFNTFSRAYLREMSKALAVLDIEHVIIPQDPRTRTSKLDQVFVRGISIEKIEIDVKFKNSDHYPIICSGTIHD